jgi:hypothetical protein
MTEEVVVEGSESPLEEVQVEQQPEPQVSAIEQKALEMGWRPKEDFQGSEDEFIDAKEFVRRQPLFEKIEAQNRQIKNVTKALSQLKEHYTKVREVEYENALKDLKSQRREALTAGDGDAFEKLDDKIKEAETQKEHLEKLNIDIPQQEEAHPEFVSWKTRNRWYDTVGYMKEFADSEGRRLHSSGMKPEAVLREVEKLVKAEFPNKFRNPNKDAAPDVERSGGGTKRTGEGFEMNEQERKVMNDLVRQKVMTKEQYIADLKKVKGIA